MAAPTRYPDWATVAEVAPSGAPNKVDTPTEFKTSGLKAGEPLPRAYLNDQLNLIGLWVRHLEETISTAVTGANAALIDQLNPVGTIWQTKGTQNPGTQFGVGTWVKITGRFLVGQDPENTKFDVVGETGGSENHSHTSSLAVQSHILTIDQLPAHGHEYRDRYYPEKLASLTGRNATNYEAMPANYNRSVGTNSTDTDNTHWLYFDSTTELTGNSQGHNHGLTGSINSASTLPPYLVINIWERIV